VTADILASMYAEAVRGVPVEESRFVASDDDRATYRQIVVEIAAARAANPAVQFDIPNEIQPAVESSP
jgi:hypothetical protein